MPDLGVYAAASVNLALSVGVLAIMADRFLT